MSGHLDADRDRHDEDGVRALRALVILAPLVIVLAVVASALGWVDTVNGALSGAPAAPVAAPSVALPAPVSASGPVAPYSDGVPFHDAAGEPWCLPGASLFDTEQVGAGSGDGVVCRRYDTPEKIFVAGGDFR